MEMDKGMHIGIDMDRNMCHMHIKMRASVSARVLALLHFVLYFCVV